MSQYSANLPLLAARALPEANHVRRRSARRAGGLPIEGLEPRRLLSTISFANLHHYAVADEVTGAMVADFIRIDSPPTDISLSHASVPEYQRAGTVVGTLAASDPDVGDSFTYKLVAGTGSDDNAAFKINGSVLKTRAMFDFDVKRRYTIRVQCTDASGMTVEKALTVRVSNVNWAPGDLMVLPPAGAARPFWVWRTLGTLTTYDPDLNDTFTYSLVSGEGSTDNGAFRIVGDQLLTTGWFMNSIRHREGTIRLRVTDQGGLSYERQYPIFAFQFA